MYNLKIAFRNLVYNGLYSWINILGLSIGLSACILLTLWLQSELTFDHFHKKANEIYRINKDMGDMGYWKVSPAPLAPMVLENNPEVLDFCRVEEYYADFFEYDNRKFFDISCIAVDDNFFSFFDFTLLEGNRNNPFQDDLSLIISESKAKIIFGNESPIGKVIKDTDALDFHIVGVVKDAPDNSNFQFDFIIPRLVLQKKYRGNGIWKHIDDDWGWYRYETFFLLHSDVNPDILAKKISDQEAVVRSKETSFEEKDYSLSTLQPLKKIHLYDPDGNKSSDLKTLYLLAGIMLFILLIACINYVNLVTARGTKRSREIAMRKIMGASKKELFFQLLLEALLLLILSFVMASIFVYLLIPTYNTITGKSLAFSFINPVILLVYMVMLVSVIVLAALYPTLSLLSFSPLAAFRNYISGKKYGGTLRKLLVILQFSISIILILSAFTINYQIAYMRKKDLGYDKENVFTMPAKNMAKHYDAVRNELLKSTQIVDVTGGSMENMFSTYSRGGTFWKGKSDDYNPVIYIAFVKSNFTELMNIKMLEGEPLSSQDSFSILINENAKHIMKMENPIGQLFYMSEGDIPYIIKGVVKDFNFAQLNKQIEPLVITNSRYNINYVYVKVRPGGAKEAIDVAEKLWKQYNSDYDFKYTFIDDTFDYYYKKEIYLERIITFLTIIAVFISCLGLFGLATYTAETRTKEIGIRKTLGASTWGIVGMLSKEFVILVCIATVVGIPIAYYLMNKLLQSYVYRISITWWMIFTAILVVLVLVVLTVSAQALRAAKANPVKAIKTE